MPQAFSQRVSLLMVIMPSYVLHIIGFQHHEDRITLRLSRGATRFSPRQPTASADCYAPLIECSSFDLNALDAMAWIDEFMRCFCGKRPLRPNTNKHSRNGFMLAGGFIIAT